ncbi:hypothetical protein DFH06DRAFT_364608 [Mycena polygramma]|nr:hypothetical protein DFH06DRAFT_364608 [Mycena polygramma]
MGWVSSSYFRVAYLTTSFKVLQGVHLFTSKVLFLVVLPHFISVFSPRLVRILFLASALSFITYVRKTLNTTLNMGCVSIRLRCPAKWMHGQIRSALVAYMPRMLGCRAAPLPSHPRLLLVHPRLLYPQFLLTLQSDLVFFSMLLLGYHLGSTDYHAFNQVVQIPLPGRKQNSPNCAISLTEVHCVR